MNNILITGGAGFIGSNLAIKLMDRGFNVTVLDNLSPQIHGDNPEQSTLFLSIKDKVSFINGSVTDRKTLEMAIDKQDFIVHLAAETGTGQSMYDIKRYTDVNIGGTALMLDILTNKPHNIKRIVVASSRAIYGEGKYVCDKCGDVYPLERVDKDMQKGDFECHCPICKASVKLVATTEDSLIHPTSVYGITKYNQEQMVLTVCKAIGVDAVALRYQNVYGPGQSLSNPYTGILSIFSTQILNNNNINIFEDGLETRDFVFIDDVVDATILALETKEAAGNAFNIGTGVATDVIEVAKHLIKSYNSQSTFAVSGNYRLGDIRHNFADISLAGRLLGYLPKVSFEQGIERFTSWVKQQAVCEDKYSTSIDELKSKGLYK
jgi:dTDP-L-rhamnose 4-epimerase